MLGYVSRVWNSGGLSRLRHLDLQGCQLVDDLALVYLSRCGPSHPVCPISYLNAGVGQQECPGYCICFREVADDTYTDSSRHTHCGHHPVISTTSLRCVQNEKPSKCSMYLLQNKNTSETDIEEIHCESSKTLVGQDIVAVNSQWEKRSHHTPEYINFNNNSKFSHDSLVPKHSRQIEDTCLHHHQHHKCNMGTNHGSLMKDYSSVCKLSRQVDTTGGQCGTNCHSVGGRLRVTQDTLRYSGLQLETLSLSGCWRVTDFGLGALAQAGAVSGLTSLDVSGCYRLSGRGLGALAAACPTLHPDNLWYCDNIDNGPYPFQANGCANLANPIRVCCRSGR